MLDSQVAYGGCGERLPLSALLLRLSSLANLNGVCVRHIACCRLLVPAQFFSGCYSFPAAPAASTFHFNIDKRVSRLGNLVDVKVLASSQPQQTWR